MQLGDQIYGPYDADQMKAFVREGRVISGSMISKNPNQGFLRAGQTELFQPIGNVPSPLKSQPFDQSSTVPKPNLSFRVVMVMAEISSDQAMQFLHLIQRLGTAQRIGDKVWLLKSEVPLADVQKHLSSSLTRLDRLFLSECSEQNIAWYNLGADMGERIKALWTD